MSILLAKLPIQEDLSGYFLSRGGKGMMVRPFRAGFSLGCNSRALPWAGMFWPFRPGRGEGSADIWVGIVMQVLTSNFIYAVWEISVYE